ncbi:DUF1294 domain-containing protein [Halalkalibacter akibai]|uniref:Membrane spanning protein n=1 Tax=Halalkalibacter akibai (strain ATCC 43226 / DSM 21942 / CIP 109018 / JCM 9157 / 1139) TaxID=1236973 RepID=W4QRY7_HALA3|nr:DUF1294 domain-containing protein [Halalkalibacter akibai]GAE34089.1 membrane spanning protein [Halalkalibacter akibai JCM 9157]
MLLTVYLIVINILAYVIMGLDKTRAKQGQRRVAEKTLFLFAWLAGSLGVYVGMKAFRHKTKKKKFYIGVPIILFIQLLVLVFILQVITA